MTEPHLDSERDESDQDEPSRVELDHAGSTNEPGEGGAIAGADTEAGPTVQPGVGGFQGRDPSTDMPRVPSAPETQKDPKSHDAAPDNDEKERDPGN